MSQCQCMMGPGGACLRTCSRPSYKLNLHGEAFRLVCSLLLLQFVSSGMRFTSLRVLLPLGFLATLDIVHAAHLELRGKTGVPRSELQRRTSISGLQSSLQDDNNVQYMTNITLNGETFNVLIDTGRKVCISRRDCGTYPDNT
jgi:predicted aspartyl protease